MFSSFNFKCKFYWFLFTIAVSITANSLATNSLLKKEILIISYDRPSYQTVSQTIKEEFESKYKIKELIIDDNYSYEDFKSELGKKENESRFMVFMDNKIMEMALIYNKENVENPVSGVVLMALNTRALLKNQSNICGITYEVPAYTLVTQFRYIIEKPIKKILAFYRKDLFQELVDEIKQQLSLEQVSFHAVDITDNINNKNYSDLIAERNIKIYSEFDAIYLILDSDLLTPEALKYFWIPLSEKVKQPLITGVKALLSPNVNLAVFAVTPNLKNMAKQAAQLIENVLDNNEPISKIGIENVISVDKYLNQRQVDKLGIKIKTDKINDVQLIK